MPDLWREEARASDREVFIEVSDAIDCRGYDKSSGGLQAGYGAERTR